MANPAASWHPDPTGRHELRYWDGTRWTEHVSDAGRTGTDPLAPPTPMPTSSRPAGFAPPDPSARAAGADTSSTVGPPPSAAGTPPWSAPSGPPPTSAADPAAGSRTEVRSGSDDFSSTPRPPGPHRAILLGVVLVLVGALIGGGIVILTRDDGEESAVEYVGTAWSDRDATIEGPQGFRLDVPAGAVPLDRTGQIAQILVTIEQIQRIGAIVGETPGAGPTTTLAPTVELAAGVRLAEEVFALGPPGQTFETPVTLSLPLPDGVDAGTVGGLVAFDELAAQWLPVPGRVVDGKVVGEITRFSTLAVWYADDAAERDAFRAANGGTIEVTNEGAEPGSFPASFFGLPAPRSDQLAVDYGVCVESATLVDPDLEWYVNPQERTGVQARPGDDSSGGTREFWLPSGTYQLTEYWSAAEIVTDGTGYVPLSGWASRPLGTVTVEPGSSQVFDAANVELADPAAGWTPTRPTCAGVVVPSLGTGEVQVTLSWPQSGVDLDLHVTDPDGFEISFSDPVSPSGGELDADNQVGAGVPENIFWDNDAAPSGRYEVAVVYFSGIQPADWTVRIVVDGRVQSFRGTLTSGDDRIEVTAFDVD